MFNPKKTIPKLAVAMLALTGCGDDDGNGAGTGGAGGGGADFDASLNAYCMNAAPCFDYTAETCINYYNAVNNYNDNAQCTAAQITYFDCGATKACNQLFQGACDDEYSALWTVCDEVP